MYRIALSRDPNPQRNASQSGIPEKANRRRGREDAAGDSAARSALNDLAHVTLNLNEFVYIK